MSGRKSGTSSYLGRHTTLSYLALQPRVWRRIPYLRDNDGRAPPIILAVGDRRRVHAISRRLANSVLLPESTARSSCRQVREEDLPLTVEFGRVAMAIGTFSSIPVLVVETQMGSPATQIILNEVLSDELTSIDYDVGKTRIHLPHKVVIRIGTAGAINCYGMEVISVGNVVNATHSIGVTGAIIQTLTRLDFWRDGVLDGLANKWTSLGSAFTITRAGHPRVECSRDVVEAVDAAGERLLGSVYHKGGNVTKDSLYAELDADAFLDLCRTENCRTTEMELSAIAVAAQENAANFGMISGVVGVLPDAPFAESEKAKGIAEQRSLRVAMEAVKRLI